MALFPQVHFPRVVVNLDAGDRPAERMATEVTWPVEDAVANMAALDALRAAARTGAAVAVAATP